MNRLHDLYARITSTDLEDNNKRLNKLYDPNNTIKTLIDQVEDTVEYAAAEKDPCTLRQIVNIAYALLFNINVCNDNCKTW